MVLKLSPIFIRAFLLRVLCFTVQRNEWCNAPGEVKSSKTTNGFSEAVRDSSCHRTTDEHGSKVIEV